MNINWFWRKGIAAATLHLPCFIKTHDREKFVDRKDRAIQLPSTPDNCRDPEFRINTEFNGIGNSVANSQGEPFIAFLYTKHCHNNILDIFEIYLKNH